METHKVKGERFFIKVLNTPQTIGKPKKLYASLPPEGTRTQ